MALTTCPDPARLERFALGNVGETEAESLELHLAECSPCLGILQTFSGQDELTAAMRAQGQGPLRLPLNERIRELMRSAREMNFPGTPSPDGAGEAPEQDPEPDADFLAPPQLPGELGRLGSYGVTRVLGQGGMGVVLAAEDLQLGRRVALKVLRPALATSASARRRFLREARSTAALDHEHVVRVYHVSEDRGFPYFAMQFLDGETLEARLRHGPLPVPELVRLGAELAEGLAAAHAHGLLHRDVKPANVFLERVKNEGGAGTVDRVKLVDFGLAWIADGDTALTGHGTVLGTPPYMAPEQARGEKVDARSDLFSLGSVLYAMASGRPPFQAETTYATLRQVSEATPMPLAELNRSLPGWLIGLINRLHARGAEDRPASAAEVAGILRAHLGEPGQLVQAPVARPPAVRPPGNARRGRSWRSRVAAAVFLATVGGFVLAEATGMTGLHRLFFQPPPAQVSDTNGRAPQGPLAEGKALAQAGRQGGEQKPPAVYPAALFPFEERGVRDLGGKVSDLLFARLAAAPELMLVDRTDLKKTLQELELNLSGAVKTSEANRIGQFTGAKLLISGTVLLVDRDRHLIARIVGTETSRVTGVSVKGRIDDPLGPLVDQLAQKVTEAIAKHGDKLIARAVTKKDRLAELDKALGKGKRPRLLVQIGERHLGGARIDPAAQTEVMYFAKETGFVLIDPEEGIKGEADVLIRGEGLCETASRQGNLVAVKARVEVRAVERKTDRVLAVDRQTALVVDLTEQLAGKAALQEAAARLAERLLPKLLTK